MSEQVLELPALGEPAARPLRRSCLSYSEVLAQSLSVIAPSTVPAALLGLVFAQAGHATWLSFLLGALGVTLVGLNINQFARRSASSGSLYSYIARGLSPTAGILSAWALLFAYTLTGMSTLCGFAVIANVLLKQLCGTHLAVIVLFGLGAAGTSSIAFRDVRLSAKTMLFFEGLSLLVVIVLGFLIWANAKFAIDRSQITLVGATPGGAFAGEVLVIFALSGFESSTALGDEARDPLHTIPRSVLHSVMVTGVFFVVMAYIVVLGFERSARPLGESEAPLNTLATAIGWPGLGTLIDIGILLSFFSCTLASINSTARILFAMARHGVISVALGRAHVKNRTPHVAVALVAVITFGVPVALYATGISAFGCEGYFGTLASFGFIVVYILVSVAAPMYLASLGQLTVRAVACAVAGVAFMVLALIGAVGVPGSAFFPVSSQAGVLVLAIFVAYMAVALGWLLVQRVRRPTMIAKVQRALDQVHDACESVPTP